jgi:hypothetical protein
MEKNYEADICSVANPADAFLGKLNTSHECRSKIP